MDNFDFIAPIYGLFYTYQKRHYTAVLDKIKDVDLSQYRTIIDIGCGTGALCSVLSQRGFIVTGIDPALKMLSVGARKQENEAIEFIQASALKRLPFADKSNFNFIKHAEAEVRESFNDVRVLDVGLRSAWYIGAPAP